MMPSFFLIIHLTILHVYLQLETNYGINRLVLAMLMYFKSLI
ncbi:hypothetical protein ACJIZ3_025545 [Penstemon smallii]|uniref:Uncharacterized protein n=1 Tax=Penstemon smallii TaxID=265156 RepID=A0ABD3TUV3_9LAMI